MHARRQRRAFRSATAVASAIGTVLATILATVLAAVVGFGPATRGAAATVPPVALGAYAAGYSGAGTQLAAFERVLGSKVAIASSFRGWGDVFPDAAQRADADTGHVLLVAWDLGATAATRFTTFPAHAHDAYLAQEAAAARAYGRTLYVRPWPEMNGDWQPFQPTADGAAPAGGTFAQFVTAWRYLVTFFRDHGATNVRWVFDPTADTYAETTDVRSIWPGAAYVDVLGLDGYNWGTGGVFRWRSFADVFAAQYRRLTALTATRPVWICEFGSKEPTRNDGAPIDRAHTKASWYSDAWSFIAGATRIRAAVLFNVRKERDWRIESDAANLRSVARRATSAAKRVS
jgi:mannan endo-1,4-beta-mannosidase